MKRYIRSLFLLMALSSVDAQTITDGVLEYEHNGCLWPFFSKDNGKTIATQAEFENAVRQDASRKHCLKNLEPIDFEKYVLVGNIINSGYCHRPPALNYVTEYFEESKTLYLNISYAEASRGVTCRAASRYDLWLLIPKPDETVEVVTRLNPIDATDFHNDALVKHKEEFHQQIKAFFSFAEQRKWDKILDATYPKLFDLQPRDKMLQALKQSYDGEHLKMYFSDFKYNQDLRFFKVDSLNFALVDYTSKIEVKFFQKDQQTNDDFEDYLDEKLVQFGKQYPTSNIKKESNTLIIEGPKKLLGIYDQPQAKWTFIEIVTTSSQLINILFDKETAESIIEKLH
ncbi:hypothetical protein [Winogradskyella sp.]|uniref:hypothetical protein n=1 Tax=Winogradskyella sp. TaxID=1883156 RepID=UPI00260574C0|nr:hypothetical protein [Winogradskyella sp.]